MNQKSYLNLFALIATILMWSSAFIAIRIGIQEYHAGSFALLRLGIAAFSLLIIYAIKPPKNPIAKKDIFFAMMLGVVGMGIYQTFINLGELTVTAGIASFIIAQVPIVTTLFSVIFLKEKVHKLGWFGLIISVSGVLLIAVGEIENAKFDFGVIFILISTFAACIYMTQAKQLLTRMNSIYLTVFVVLGGALSTLVFMPQLIHDLPRASASATWAAVYLGIFPTTLAYLTYNFALSNIPRTTAVSWLYAMPLVTSLMGWIWLGELPTLLAFTGGMIALGGTILVNAVTYQRTKSHHTTVPAIRETM